MRKIKDEFEARACLAKVAASGRPLAVWARGHGIDGRSLMGHRETRPARGVDRADGDSTSSRLRTSARPR